MGYVITSEHLDAFTKECDRQSVGPLRVMDLANAWYLIFISNADRIMSLPIIMSLGKLIEPEANNFWWRQTEVIISTGSKPGEEPAPAKEVPSRMERWWDLHEHMTTDEAVKEFLIIHPFADGNGRAAFLIQNWLDNTLKRCQPLRDHF